MTKLIAMIDGSVYAESVCDHAAWAARRTGASVELIHVLDKRKAGGDGLNLSGNIGLGARSTLLAQLTELDERRAKLEMQHGRQVLDDAVARVTADGVADVTTRLRHGDLIDAVHEFESDADLIVIGKRGEAADFAKLHLGSNLERAVRGATKPVLVTARAFRPIESFLIAFDGGPSAMKAVRHIAEGDLFKGLACSLVTVGAPTADASRRLEEAERLLTDAGFTVDAGFESGEPEAAIQARIERDGVDLLVMGAYGHSRVRTLIIGSTTTEMMRSCRVPVLLFR
ncbi:nucleotide-binding universal stress UspA family protein [Rhodothalassium salexigens DSM 2132]|uniref:Nucleotide-binding universal stress UspA family protein n=1 Tax=Rhodothalassium salexigens DSM 2132 TaxID=1188247 RepID=A0A4R2P812_RHOSA|nr:universal stress protein [Rhodothalassium salexigens]MBB4212555.1 nucleotide-binding universal stress UspA family protein [Rhodothalassium salexigens DSM 2132]MBK1639899.1 universal stress protein UspA [Rhodothalassium salexigens DSM 2132]TCP31100.1 nucleotide-binding universal stress UspA family protein [Rhodothalassium salexigens DSM 2132]